MARTINANNTSIDLATHSPSGELYVLRYASEWEDNECVGATIIEAVGGLEQREFLDEAGEPLADWVDRAQMTIANNPTDAVDDATWANAQQWTVIADHLEG